MNSAWLIALLAAVWAGFVLAISFMESWVKFRAPGVTRDVGLSVGSLVFKTMNRVEWGFLIVAGALFSFATNAGQATLMVLTTLLFILLSQTFFLLPVLTQRAQMLINGIQPPKSGVHLFYVVAEVLKLGLLAVLVAGGYC